jgi:hypothetical protein
MIIHFFGNSGATTEAMPQSTSLVLPAEAHARGDTQHSLPSGV